MSRSSAVDWNSRMKRAVAQPVQAVGTPYPHAESGQFRLELYGAFDELRGYAEKQQEGSEVPVCQVLQESVLALMGRSDAVPADSFAIRPETRECRRQDREQNCEKGESQEHASLRCRASREGPQAVPGFGAVSGSRSPGMQDDLTLDFKLLRLGTQYVRYVQWPHGAGMAFPSLRQA
ncbi:MAG: hypothetical protein LBR80_00095 [Deltaproteobacteria bacterium]|nr:hypothetical protein [Deltaproteobacteria bacterium]